MDLFPGAEPSEEPPLAWIHEHWASAGLVVAAFLLVVLGSVGRWLPVALLLVWLHVPLYLLHQFEEHAWPGGFGTFVNREYLDVDRDHYPLTEWDLTLINVHLTWLLMPGAAVLATVEFAIAVWIPVLAVCNGLIHLSHVLYLRSYHPGVATTLLLNVPVGAVTLSYAIWMGIVSWAVFWFWVVVVVGGHLAILAVLLYRLRETGQPARDGVEARARDS